MTKIVADPGTEGYIKFGRARLAQLTAMRKDLRLPVMNKHWQIDAATRVDVRSSEFGDMIRVTGGAPWDFFLQDAEFFGDQRIDYFFGKVDRPKLRKVSNRADITSGAFSSKTSSQFAVHNPVSGWQQIDKTQRISAYAPADFGGSITTPTPTSSDTKIISVITNGPSKVLTDGTNYVSVTPLVNRHRVVATKADGFFYSEEDSVGVYQSFRIVSLAESQRTNTNGNLVNPTGVLADVTGPYYGSAGTPVLLANYTDFFTADIGPVGSRIYRNGVLEASPIFAAVGQSTVCSRDTFAAWGSFGVSAAVLLAQRQSDGSYTYTSNTYAFDADYLSSYGTFSTSLGFSDSASYYFNTYIRTLTAGPDPQVIVTGCLSSGGAVVQTTNFPVTYAEYTAFPVPPIAYFSIPFFSKSCWIGATSKGTALRRHLFFYFSDGTNQLVVFPAGAADIVPSNVVGSQTKAYASVTDAGINYLVCSDGTLTALPAISRLAADGVSTETPVLVLVAGFIDQKEGCRLMVEAFWGTSPVATVHHYDETGALFDYEDQTLDYGLFPTLTVAAPTPLKRMELIESWGLPT